MIWQNQVNMRSDGKPSRGILEAVDFWLLSDFEISTTFEKDLTITITITIMPQRAPITPPQGVLTE